MGHKHKEFKKDKEYKPKKIVIKEDKTNYNSVILETAPSRYFVPIYEPKCYNCGEKGHLISDCPDNNQSPCMICSRIGHLKTECPYIVCNICRTLGHGQKNCKGYSSHEEKKWRIYNFKKDHDQSSKKKIRVFCYYCASRDHFGDDCQIKVRENDLSLSRISESAFTSRHL
eukprot:GHVP01061876.1.p1 GENE.GHVP01061876.1~~GHVP01061876.1.p1  ORF type:complete len:171 (+),score=20.68 GHVP01061876.1:444-956(+)